MASQALRTGAPALRLQSHLTTRQSIRAPRLLHSLSSINHPNALRAPKVPNKLLQAAQEKPTQPSHSSINPATTRTYATTQTPTANALIEEIQDLYEVAKDEFEIATDSTDSATIYAASDRESARDALNELCAVYYLYTVDGGAGAGASTGVVLPGRGPDGMPGEVPGEEIGSGKSLGERGPVIEPGFPPEEIGDAVREEVRRRIGQRIRELRNAVEMLEERAHED